MGHKARHLVKAVARQLSNYWEAPAGLICVMITLLQTFMFVETVMSLKDSEIPALPLFVVLTFTWQVISPLVSVC